MANLTTNECYDRLKEHYEDCRDCEAIIQDLCNCFDSNVLTEFVKYIEDEYEES